MILLLSGFIGIAATFYLFDSSQIEATKRINQYQSFALETSKLHELVLLARNDEKEFLLSLDKKLILQHDEDMKNIFQELEVLKKEAPTKELLEEIEKSELFLGVYGESTRDMFASSEELGLNENEGLMGAMRAAVHDIEEIVIAEKSDAMLAKMLMMRRHEKDFLAREDEKYIERQTLRLNEFNKLINTSNINKSTKDNMKQLLQSYYNIFLEVTGGVFTVNTAVNELQDSVAQVEIIISKLIEDAEAGAINEVTIGAKQTSFLTWLFIVVLAAISMIIIVAVMVLSESINRPLEEFQKVISDLGLGNLDSRVNRNSLDELGELGRSFDAMLDERLAIAEKAQKENDALNNSIIALLNAAADLSERDLTVHVPVAEDITGAISDALNLMTGQIAKVMTDVNSITQEVVTSSGKVSEQGELLNDVASSERQDVENTMKALDRTVISMNSIAELAKDCNDIAGQASSSTGQALTQVLDTATGINDIRETIAETEKRIKRLGERSQEISSVVEIINNVAERTHVLALNASMQAAAAGDAGRGFSVVADEVQRLAKSSRESTSEIATLVTNIQSETAETMEAMNKAIGQVVEGTKMAESSGEQMRETQKTTAELAEAVKRIASNSEAQAVSSKKLREESQRIVNSTTKTAEELGKQKEETGQLVDFSQQLNEAVSVFKLPS